MNKEEENIRSIDGRGSFLNAFRKRDIVYNTFHEVGNKYRCGGVAWAATWGDILIAASKVLKEKEIINSGRNA